MNFIFLICLLKGANDFETVTISPPASKPDADTDREYSDDLFAGCLTAATGAMGPVLWRAFEFWWAADSLLKHGAIGTLATPC